MSTAAKNARSEAARPPRLERFQLALPDFPHEVPSEQPNGTYHARNKLNDLTGTEWVRFTKSWFVCDGRKWQFTEDIEQHPASFPPDVAAHFIRFFTKRSETVLDPFVGCGSTLAACWETARNGIGVEISPRYYKATKKRINGFGRVRTAEGGQQELLRETPTQHYQATVQKVIQADARRLSELGLPPVDLCVTSPPYWDMLKQSRGHVESTHKRRARKGLDTHYSDDPADLGNITDYVQYLEDLTGIFAQVRDLLRPGKYLVVIMQNVRPPSGEMIPVAWDVARALSRIYTLRQEMIWCQDQKMLGCWGYPSTYVSNVHHHYCLILQKEGANDQQRRHPKTRLHP